MSVAVVVPAEAPTKKSGFVSSMFAKKQRAGSSIADLAAEFQRYIDLPVVDEDVDPLQWWKIHRTDFPNLFRMAKVRQSSNTSNFRRIIWQFLPLRHQLNVSFLVGRG